MKPTTCFKLENGYFFGKLNVMEGLMIWAVMNIQESLKQKRMQYTSLKNGMLNPKKLFYQINVRWQKKFKKILHITRSFVKPTKP